MTADATGLYSVTVTAGACVSTSANVPIIVNPLPNAAGAFSAASNNGVVVFTNNSQDAVAYQRLLERAARADMAETVTAIQQGLADAVAGRVKPARQALETLARKYGISDKET